MMVDKIARDWNGINHLCKNCFINYVKFLECAFLQ